MINSVLSLGRALPFVRLTSTFVDSSCFHPCRSRREAHCCRKRRLSDRRIRTVSGAWLPVDPWAPVVDSQSVASQLFAFSLFPYIGFLYFITKSKSAPKLTLFGFYFLLAFVGATSVHRYLEKRDLLWVFRSNYVGFSATTLTFLIVFYITVCSSPIYPTVPAGIYAKVHYGTSLSNVDWLHGGAESLLTVTNLFIVLGLREGLRKPKNASQNMPVSDLKDDK